jgi:hypothetical protein
MVKISAIGATQRVMDVAIQFLKQRTHQARRMR